MTTATATRRLAAILAEDVVGYSRLMGADEEGTHERFKAHLVELIDPKIREHHGRFVRRRITINFCARRFLLVIICKNEIFAVYETSDRYPE